jgi:hypothetical protein
MKSNGASERHQNNHLKAVIAFANFLGTDTTFLDVQLKEQITSFLDTKIKNVQEDPDKKWILFDVTNCSNCYFFQKLSAKQ